MAIDSRCRGRLAIRSQLYGELMRFVSNHGFMSFPSFM
jgi:hypothetical protein